MKTKPNTLILFSAYNMEEYVEDSILPFLEHPDCYVVASSRKFSSFPDEPQDNTIPLLKKLCKNYLNFLTFDYGDPVEKEHEAKNLMLEKFLDTYVDINDIDFIWIVDCDEFYTKEDIDFILKSIQRKNMDPYVWFTIPLKNYVFDTKTYLTEPFRPPRVFRTKFSCGWTKPSGTFLLSQFYWDNDIAYVLKEDLQKEEDNIRLYSYKQMAYFHFSEKDIWVPHYCWLSNKRSKSKVEYQNKHFGHCSYRWNQEEDCLEFDKEFYKTTGMEVPEVRYE